MSVALRVFFLGALKDGGWVSERLQASNAAWCFEGKGEPGKQRFGLRDCILKR